MAAPNQTSNTDVDLALARQTAGPLYREDGGLPFCIGTGPALVGGHWSSDGNERILVSAINYNFKYVTGHQHPAYVPIIRHLTIH